MSEFYVYQKILSDSESELPSVSNSTQTKNTLKNNEKNTVKVITKKVITN